MVSLLKNGSVRPLGIQKLAETTTKNAARGIVMMKLGAVNLGRGAEAHVHLGGEQHADGRRDEIDPQRAKGVRKNGGAERARRIHAHAREGSFEGDVHGDQRSAEIRSEARKAPVIRDAQDGEGQDKGDQEFGNGGPRDYTRTW